MPTIQSLAARMTREAAAALGRAAKATGDRMTWQPMGKGRSALDQVLECGTINLWGARVFAEKAVPHPVDMESYEALRGENNSPEQALALLERSAEALARAIEMFPTEKLNATITLPFGEGVVKTFAEYMFVFYWNMTYHEGQVNYIQTLCAY